ncbi:AtpZ/AtpI family protein [bacterium]|nr:AtpZ/AtpI family protein [bacterium]
MGDRKLYRYYARVSGAVFAKVILCAIGFWLGTQADTRFGTAPYGMFTGFLIGVSAGLWGVIRAANQDDSSPPSDPQ